MRKIINILLALSLVLAFSAVAAPVAADVTGGAGGGNPGVDVDNPCVCETSAYNITFNISAHLEEAIHEICIKFPEGTYVPPTGDDWADGDINIYGLGWGPELVFGSEVTVTDSANGTQVCFIINTSGDMSAADNPITVEFTGDAGIKNPCVDGDYTLWVWTTRVEDSTPVKSETYTIMPMYSEYGFGVDFSKTYPGLAVNFTPPFKACGQNDSQGEEEPYVIEPFDTYNYSDVWFDYFTLNFTAVTEGCNVPCDEVDIWFEVVACPDDEIIHLFDFGGTNYTLTADNITAVVGEYDSATDFLLEGNVDLEVDPPMFWRDAGLHFSSPGTYELCFYAECPGPAPCQPPGGTGIIAERCLEFKVHQWKDAAKIELRRKWNLISLPLVPFETDIDAVLAALPWYVSSNITSIWHYDRCSDKWYVKGATNSFESLTTMEDGKSYWIRTVYNSTNRGDHLGWLWVWGTEMPMPEHGPAAYAVCEGWNMVGFTRLTDEENDDYLWNWWDTTPWPDYGMIYGWNATIQDWFGLVPGGNWVDRLIPTEGYWIPFERNGTIYP